MLMPGIDAQTAARLRNATLVHPVRHAPTLPLRILGAAQHHSSGMTDGLRVWSQAGPAGAAMPASMPSRRYQA